MQAYYSCSSIADNNANLLFYTDGSTVWDATHNIMANGSGLSGSAGYYGQTVIITKQPGANSYYYIFHVSPQNCTNCTGTLYYSVVDMSLASGSGSVITKNVAVYTGSVSGKVTATRHCNGTDIWILNKDSFGWWTSSTSSGTYTPNFRAYLLTSAGLNTTAVVSSAAAVVYNNNWGGYDYYGCIKLSPNGKKLASANYNNSVNWGSNNPFELYDFDNTTGAVTNSLVLSSSSSNTWGGWSCEFSPDGTKLYGSSWYWTGTAYQGYVSQWDICAGSPTAIAASETSVATSNNWSGTMQLAPNGKIYVSTGNFSSQTLDVITAPNQLGANCGYSVQLQSTSPKNTWYSLPNMMTSYLIQRPPPTPFTYTANLSLYGCYTASFNTVYSPSTIIGCSASGYSLSSVQWNFGDPASGSANTSTLQNPMHVFTNLGTYTVNLILYYTCGGGTDTLKQVVNITQPCLTVNSTSITCANLGSATVQALGSPGPFSYTWMPTNQTNPVATGLSPGSYTITVNDQSNSFTYTAQVVFTSLIPLTGNINISNSVSCFGAATGTGNVTNIAGGSGVENYVWTNGSVTYTTPAPNNLSAGIWTVAVTDALTGCSLTSVYLISQPPAMNLVLSSNTPTTCATRSINLSGTNSGGTPKLVGSPYTYTWTGGPVSNTQVVSNVSPGTYVYTLSSKDSLNCLTSKTIAVDFVPNPTIVVSSVSICPLEVGTIFASGATSYTWNGSSSTTGSSFNASPTSNTQYTVVGSALSCTSSAVGSILLKPLPNPFTYGNTTRCQGEALSLSAYGGTSYVWSGPGGYSSSVQNLSISPVGLNNAGVYQVTVTAANSCTAPVSTTVTINPTPTVSAAGSTVCSNQVLNLSSSSLPGASFLWKGPQNFTANVQNPSISLPSVLYTGTYSVLVTSAAGCTNATAAQASVTALPNPTIISNGTVCLNGTLNFLASSTGGGSLTWIGPSGFSSTNTSTLISSAQLSASGFYTLNVVLGPCVASVSKYALVHPLPSFTMSSDVPCEGKTLHLTAGGINNASSFAWQGPSPYTSSFQNPVFTNVNQSYAGVYTLTVLDQNGCLNSATHTVTIRSNPTLTPISTTVCLHEPAVLSVSGAQTYVWTGPGSFVSYQGTTTIPSANSALPLTYTVMGTAANQCTAITTADLSTFELPVPSIAVLPTNRFCLNSTVQFQGQGGRVYDWAGPNGLVFSGQTVTFVAQSPQYEGSYTLTVTDFNNCRGVTSAAIHLDPLPQGGLIGSKMRACVPFHSEFSFYSSSASASQITTQWQMGSASFKGKQFSADFTAAGQYTINGYFTDTVNGCIKTETFVVDAYDRPKADFSYYPEHPVESTETVIFTNSSPSQNIKALNWYFFDQDGPQYNTNEVSYFFRDAGEYPVVLMIEDVNGCMDTVMKAVKVETDFSIYVPNAFTPNDDNLNEEFLPVTHGVKFYELSIFDRWGHRIFTSSDSVKGWNGTLNGEPCKQGVYIWKIKLSTTKGDEKSFNGNVTLFR